MHIPPSVLDLSGLGIRGICIYQKWGSELLKQL